MVLMCGLSLRQPHYPLQQTSIYLTRYLEHLQRLCATLIPYTPGHANTANQPKHPIASRRRQYYNEDYNSPRAHLTRHTLVLSKGILIRPRTLGLRHLNSHSRSQQQDIATRDRTPSSDEWLGLSASKQSNSIRASLREWKPPAEQVSPTEPRDLLSDSLYTGNAVNDLTRPEIDGLRGVNADDINDEVREHLQDFNRIADVSDGASVAATMLRRGDLIELRQQSTTPVLAVFLGISQNSFFQFYTIFGKLFSATWRTGYNQASNFMTREELDPIMPYVPKVTDENNINPDVAIPRNLSAPILKKMVQFRTACDAIRRKYWTELQSAFDLLAHPTEIRYMALEDIIAAVTKIPVDEHKPYSNELTFTISNSLVSDHFGFTLDLRTFASTRIISIQPRQNTVILQRVQSWLRAFQEEAALAAGGLEVPPNIATKAAIVKGFARKCQKLIAEGRQFRRYSPEGAVISCNKGTNNPASSSEHDTLHSLEFSNTDRDFIRVLKLHTLTGAILRQPSYRSMAAAIVRTVVPEKEDVEFREAEIWNFLVEIGAVDPFAQAQGFDTEVWPPNEKLAKEMHIAEARLKAGSSLAEVANLRDSMAAFRTDWGSLPVFAIDSATTEEIDDGISLEEIPEEPGCYWLRAHVAHISAFTSPSDIIGRCAEFRLTSLYLDTGANKMLPQWATQQFSIAPGSPCLTYSAKLDPDGEILDINVVPGTVRNIVYSTPEMINEGFLSSNPSASASPSPSSSPGDNIFRLRCSNEPEREPEPPVATRPLTVPTSEHMATLRKLYEFLEKIRKKRVISPVLRVGSREVSHCNVSNVKGDVAVATYSNPTHARFSLKDPIITFGINQDFDKTLLKDSVLNPSQVIVEQCMLLAGVICARWAHARNIPIIYSGTRPAVDGLDDITALTREELVQNVWNRNIVNKLLGLYAIRHLSTYPVEQKIMGVKEYAKVTSPLRRFMDLVNSWQVDAALREEHRTGVSLVGRPDVPAAFLPYQRSGAELVIRLMLSRLLDIQWWCSANRKHWEIQAVARAFYLGEGKLPSPLTCIIGRKRIGARVGILRELEFQVQIDTQSTEMDEDDIWEVKISMVHPYFRQAIVKPVRKIE